MGEENQRRREAAYKGESEEKASSKNRRRCAASRMHGTCACARLAATADVKQTSAAPENKVRNDGVAYRRAVVIFDGCLKA